MQPIKDFFNRLAELAVQALDKVKLGGVAKAVAGALGPFVTIWATTGGVDEKVIIPSLVTAVLVYYFPNFKPTPEPPVVPAEAPRYR